MTVSNDRWRSWLRLTAVVVVSGPVLAGCGFFQGRHTGVHRAAFTSKAFGVAVSPRVTRARNPPHGGGRAVVGSPYKVHGAWYKPIADPVGYVSTGQASWYGNDFHGRLTANGEIFNANAISGGSPVLPLPCYARVTNLDNGRSLLVRFNDRGPYMSGRIADLSARAAELLGYKNSGTADVRIKYVSPAPLNGDDTRFLLASLDVPANAQQSAPVQLAMAGPRQTVPLIHTQARSEPLFSSRGGGANMGSVLQSFSSLFSFAEAKQQNIRINAAENAAEAMAARAPGLHEWVQSTDIDARKIDLGLGVFPDPNVAREIAIKFAMLGAVDETPVTTETGQPATRLTLSELKPGVERMDVLHMARTLGLQHLSFD